MKKRAVFFGLALLAVVLAAGMIIGGPAQPTQLSARHPQGPVGPSSTATDVRSDADYGNLPAYFIPNRGQMDKRVAYYVRGKDKSLYFTSGGVTLRMANPGTGRRSPESHPPAGGLGKAGTHDNGESRDNWVVKLDFVGAEKGIEPRAENETGAIVSYFRGRPETWRTGHTDIFADRVCGPLAGHRPRLSRHRGSLEVRVHRSSGRRPVANIRLAYRGVDRLSVDGDGRLTVSTPAGSFQDDVPVAYQETAGKRVPVALSYKLKPAGNNEPAYGFDVGGYDSSQPLVLDPAILIYCGFIGGDYEDAGYGIAVDASGNAYLTGRTASSAATFPLIVGPDLTKYSSLDSDAFVAKLNPSGTALIYCGYIGGSSTDMGIGLDLDPAGNAYVTGTTTSTAATFPVTVGPGQSYGGSYDAWVAKVNASGTALDYCGYIGGSSEDRGTGIKVDGSGSAYVVGRTGSSEATFPAAGGPDLTFNGAGDAFVAKVDPSGSTLVYCGYIGGTDNDAGNGIALDGAGNVYVTGSRRRSKRPSRSPSVRT